MNDEELDQLIKTTGARYHAPPDPQLDVLWAGIRERRRLVEPSARGDQHRWWRVAGLAAAVGISFSLGRITVSSGYASSAKSTAATGRVVGHPVESVTSELLGQTATLLAALPSGSYDAVSDGRFAMQASELLTTTRLLLDSQVAQGDEPLRLLLQDLELVLAQVARLHTGESRTERELITEALQSQDLVPRIRSIAAGLNAGAD